VQGYAIFCRPCYFPSLMSKHSPQHGFVPKMYDTVTCETGNGRTSLIWVPYCRPRGCLVLAVKSRGKSSVWRNRNWSINVVVCSFWFFSSPREEQCAAAWPFSYSHCVLVINYSREAKKPPHFSPVSYIYIHIDCHLLLARNWQRSATRDEN
jgi:hypothetical protein